MQGELSLLLWMGYEWLKRLDGSTDHNKEDKRILSISIDISRYQNSYKTKEKAKRRLEKRI